MFVKINLLKTDSCAHYYEKYGFQQFLTGCSLLASKKCLEVDPLAGIKYFHLNISRTMHYRTMVSLEIN
jgi:hypothetical protein